MSCFKLGVLILALAFVSPQHPVPPNVNDVLTRWEETPQPPEYETLVTWAGVVAQGIVRRDPEISARILSIARSERQSLSSRTMAMRVACKVADDAGARLVLQLVEDFQAGRMIPPEVENDSERQRIQSSHIRVASGIIRDDLKYLLGATQDHRPMFTFLRDYYLHGIGRGMRLQVARLIAACNVPADLRREAVLAMIGSENRKYGAAPVPLVELLDSAGYPALRELVRAETSPLKFHYSAASALSHLGDEDIVPDLEALRPNFRAEHPNSESALLQYIWRIQVQHPPTNLLEYIASTDLPGKREWRTWAVLRAHKLGLESQQIREAILAHARNGTTRVERVELPDLKRWGLEVGILEETDLPDVQIRNRKPMP